MMVCVFDTYTGTGSDNGLLLFSFGNFCHGDDEGDDTDCKGDDGENEVKCSRLVGREQVPFKGTTKERSRGRNVKHVPPTPVTAEGFIVRLNHRLGCVNGDGAPLTVAGPDT